MRLGRRPIIWISSATAVVAVVAVALLASRQRSRFDYLYALSPTVGKYTPGHFYVVNASSKGITTRPIPTGTRPVASHPFTVLIFPRERFEKVQDLLGRHFGSARFSHPGTTGFAPDSFSYMSNGRADVVLATGSVATVIAEEAHLTLPPDGVVVTLSEEPNWFSARLSDLRRFLHLD